MFVYQRITSKKSFNKKLGVAEPLLDLCTGPIWWKNPAQEKERTSRELNFLRTSQCSSTSNSTLKLLRITKTKRNSHGSWKLMMISGRKLFFYWSTFRSPPVSSPDAKVGSFKIFFLLGWVGWTGGYDNLGPSKMREVLATSDQWVGILERIFTQGSRPTCNFIFSSFLS